VRRDLGLGLVAAAGVAAFALLAVGYDSEPFVTIDSEALAWTANDMPGWLVTVARPFSWVGGWIGLTVLGVVAFVLLLRERAWLDLAFFLAAFLGTQALVSALKAVFDRARPELEAVVDVPGSPAFPSGHAAAGAASFLALAVLVSERLPRPLRPEFWVAVGALGVAIGLSRIALNVHFVTDVVAGWSLGVAWLAACLLARDRLARGRRTGPSAPDTAGV
jgi:undecaprenyl-diphosphatase